VAGLWLTSINRLCGTTAKLAMVTHGKTRVFKKLFVFCVIFASQLNIMHTVLLHHSISDMHYLV